MRAGVRNLLLLPLALIFIACGNENEGSTVEVADEAAISAEIATKKQMGFDQPEALLAAMIKGMNEYDPQQLVNLIYYEHIEDRLLFRNLLVKSFTDEFRELQPLERQWQVIEPIEVLYSEDGKSARLLHQLRIEELGAEPITEESYIDLIKVDNLWFIKAHD